MFHLFYFAITIARRIEHANEHELVKNDENEHVEYDQEQTGQKAVDDLVGEIESHLIEPVSECALNERVHCALGHTELLEKIVYWHRLIKP